MGATTVKPGSATELLRLFAMLTNSIGESMGSLVGRPIVMRPGEAEVQDAEAFGRSLARPYAVARGALDKASAGKTMAVLIEIPDAIAMAGHMMMAPDETIAERRQKGVLGSEDATAFGELGNVMFAAFANVLRDNVGNADVRFQDHGIARGGADKNELLGSGPAAVFGFRLKIGEYPESRGHILVDQATAEAWNKGPLAVGGDEPLARPATPGRADDDGLDSIPQAPIRGTLAAFVMQPEVFRMLRRSCRRVGLDLRRHGRGEVPNPAAHRNEFVLMDVPPGEDRRFDWCRRIKELSDSTKVVLLIHHPSRHRVTQAFLSRADAILGFPCDELHLSQKLAMLMPDAPTP